MHAHPRLSVVVPVHNAARELDAALAALVRSDLPKDEWELIVVDDSSEDDSAAIAALHADLVVRLPHHARGPAYARNRGAEAARGAFVAFVDADVIVRRDALPRMLALLGADASIGAVMGSYSAAPAQAGLLSEYRNLLRHCAQLSNTGDTDVFAAGFAMVRRDAFQRAGMYDEWRFNRPQAEALELGERLRGIGYRIVQSDECGAVHLKVWTLRTWLLVDLLERGISIARLPEGPAMRAKSERIYHAAPLDAALSCFALLAAGAALVNAAVPLTLASGAGVTAVLVSNGRLFRCLARHRGPLFAIAAIPLHLIACAAWGVAYACGRVLFHMFGEAQPDPVIQAYAEVGVRTWPPVPLRRD